MRKSLTIKFVLLTALTLFNLPMCAENGSSLVSFEIGPASVPKKYKKIFDDLHSDFDSTMAAAKNTSYPFLLSSAMIESYCRQFDTQFAAAIDKMLIFGNGANFIGRQEILEQLFTRLKRTPTFWLLTKMVTVNCGGLMESVTGPR